MGRGSNGVERSGGGPRAGELGPRIRRERTARGLSLAQVASVTGLTKSLLSQVERGIAEPSLSSLRKVSLALGVPLSTLFAEPPRPGTVLRRNGRKEVSWPALGVSYDLLSADDRKTIQMAFIRLAVGAKSCETPTVGHGAGEECAVVITGLVDVLVGDARHTLEEDDSITFDCSVPHQYVNVGSAPATIVAAMSPSVF
jgi:transcriptional regulator with XRE-family HTH domain